MIIYALIKHDDHDIDQSSLCQSWVCKKKKNPTYLP